MDLGDLLLDPDVTIVGIGPGGGRRSATVGVRVSPELAPELHEALRKADLFVGFEIQESAAPLELASLIASVAGGLSGVAAVLKTFFHRHRDRRVTVVHDGKTFDLRGMSQHDMEALTDRIVRLSADKQQEAEEMYHQHLPGFE